ncbi:MAG: hypothetical protein R2911_30045 [Caldilineaceae bacterium]
MKQRKFWLIFVLLFGLLMAACAPAQQAAPAEERRAQPHRKRRPSNFGSTHRRAAYRRHQLHGGIRH